MPKLASTLRAIGDLREAGESGLFGRVCAFSATVPLLMRLPLSRLDVLLARSSRHIRRRPEPISPERLERLVALAQRVGAPVVRTGCLTRGLTMFWFLRRRGVDVELCFGLSGAGDGYDGHCWLVLQGEPLLERVDPRDRFSEHYRLPARSGT